MNTIVRNRIIEIHWKDNYTKLVKVISRRVGGNMAMSEDIVSEAYCRAMSYWGSFNPEVRHFRAWFGRILNNTTRDYQKDERNSGCTMDDDFDVPAESDPNQDILIKLRDEISDIDDEYRREVVDLFFNKGFSPKEISNIVEGATASSVYNHIKRFKEFVSDKYQ